MTMDNLTDLIELINEQEDIEPDPRLESGQVTASDGTIITL
jgi:hypothetical protein